MMLCRCMHGWRAARWWMDGCMAERWVEGERVGQGMADVFKLAPGQLTSERPRHLSPRPASRIWKQG